MDTDTRYHVFLSHNHADQPVVADLARRLVEAGPHPWFAATHLISREPKACRNGLIARPTKQKSSSMHENCIPGEGVARLMIWARALMQNGCNETLGTMLADGGRM